jgi:hypothetical protein
MGTIPIEPTTADLCVPPCYRSRETTVVCPTASEPTEPPWETIRPVQNSRIPAAGATTPCRLNKKLAIKHTISLVSAAVGSPGTVVRYSERAPLAPRMWCPLGTDEKLVCSDPAFSHRLGDNMRSAPLVSFHECEQIRAYGTPNIEINSEHGSAGGSAALAAKKKLK